MSDHEDEQHQFEAASGCTLPTSPAISSLTTRALQLAPRSPSPCSARPCARGQYQASAHIACSSRPDRPQRSRRDQGQAVQDRGHVHLQDRQARPRKGPSHRHRCASPARCWSYPRADHWLCWAQIFTGKKLVRYFFRTLRGRADWLCRKISAPRRTTWTSPP